MVYPVSFPGTLATLRCPLLGCPGMSSRNSGIHCHFKRRHWGDSMIILEEHTMPYPHCERCVQQVVLWILNNCHFNNAAFRVGQKQLSWQETLQHFFRFIKWFWMLIYTPWIPQRPSHTLGVQSLIIRATGRHNTPTSGRRRNSGGWYQMFYDRQGCT